MQEWMKEFNKQLEEQEKLPSIFTRNAPKSLEEIDVNSEGYAPQQSCQAFFKWGKEE